MVPARRIAPGVEMPLLGLGVYQSAPGRETRDAVRWALAVGYRHVDTAQAYGNEGDVGAALRDAGVPPDEVFVTTKFHPRRADPAAELEGSLERLGLERVDLYLVHWPQGGPLRAWPGMERAHEAGLARAVGISNFSLEQVDAVLARARVRPVVNQVQFSPLEFRGRLLEGCAERGIVLEAYSPLTRGAALRDPTVTGIAARHGHTPAQVLLRWALEREVPVIPKSVRRERIEENARALDWTLPAEDVRALDALDRTGGTDRARESTWW